MKLAPLRLREAVARVRGWFPDREFFMRAEGQVRFIRISSRLQMTIAGAIAAALLLWVLVMAATLVSQFTAARDHAALLEREAAVASAENRVAKYRGGLEGVADDLNRRQDFIEKAIEGTIGELPKDLPRGTVSDSTGEAAKTVRKVSAVLPEARRLAEVEARQLAFIERLTRFADARSVAAETRHPPRRTQPRDDPLGLAGGDRWSADPPVHRPRRNARSAFRPPRRKP